MENNNKRREFLKKSTGLIGLGILGIATGSMINGCEEIEYIAAVQPRTYEIKIDSYPSLSNVGGMVQMFYTIDGGKELKLILVRKASNNSKDDFVIVEAVCRHNNCGLSLPDSLDGHFVCNCHGAKFSPLTGEMVDSNGIPEKDVPDLIKYSIEGYNDSSKILTVYLQ